MSRRTVIVGTGGHSGVVAELVSLVGHEIAGFLDVMYDGGTHHEGRPVFRSLPSGEVFWLVVAIGDNAVRKSVSERVDAHVRETGSEWVPALVHPSAVVSTSALLARGSTIHAGAFLGPNARVGRHCIVNSHAVVEHDCLLEDFSSLAPAAVMGGAATLREEAFLGMSATLLQGRSIGERSIVGAGALVIDDVPSGRVAYGSPARDHRSVMAGDSPFRSS